MTKDRCTCLNACLLLNALSKPIRMTDSFCIHDHLMCHACFSVALDDSHQTIIIVIKFLRDQDLLCTISNTTPQCNISCWAAHNLDNADTLMRVGSLADAVNCFHCCIYCSVKTNRILSVSDIQIDRARNTNNIYTIFWQITCPLERAVTTNNDQSFNTEFFTDSCCFLLTGVLTKLCTSCCKQKCTTML